MIKRYELEIEDYEDNGEISTYCGMSTSEKGDYVLYSDYRGDIADRDFRIESLEKRLEELGKENDTLTDVISAENKSVRELEATAKANEEDLKRLRQYERRI